MRHQKIKGRLSRPLDKRKALLRSLLRGLIISGRINVTLARAKEVKKVMDKLLNISQKNNLTTQRYAFTILQDKKIVYKLFNEIALKFSGGSNTRIIHLFPRRGDGAKMAIIELFN